MRLPSLFAVVLALTPAGFAQEAPTGLDAELRYQRGKVTVGDSLATFDLGEEFRYLDPAQSERLLVEGWGNPPGNETLGMIFPSELSPLSPEGWGIIISFEEDGYVEDDEAEKLDYDDLLQQMKKEVTEANEERQKAGYEPIDLVGWAERPHYDPADHKLYWAKQLRFGDAEQDTLNYNIRALGRRGVLVLNAVASMDQMATVQASMQELLPAVELNAGHRYSDFVPGTDKVAEYGIGALIAGTLAAKSGLFKVLLAGLLAFKKVIVVGVVAAGVALKKLLGKKQPADYGPA